MPVILATQEAESGKIVFPGHLPQKNFLRLHLNQWLDMVTHVCHPQLPEDASGTLSQK
jgi:hypothetical protein